MILARNAGPRPDPAGEPGRPGERIRTTALAQRAAVLGSKDHDRMLAPTSKCWQASILCAAGGQFQGLAHQMEAKSDGESPPPTAGSSSRATTVPIRKCNLYPAFNPTCLVSLHPSRSKRWEQSASLLCVSLDVGVVCLLLNFAFSARGVVNSGADAVFRPL